MTEPPHDPAYDEPDAYESAETPLPVRPQRRNTAPSHDADAEAGLLGCMLVSLDACEQVLATGLEPDELYVPGNQAIYAAICQVAIAGDQPDAVTVDAIIGGGDQLRSRLLDLIVNAPIWRNAPVYARRVRTLARLRAVTAAAIEVTELARSEDLDGALAKLAHITADLPADDAATSWRAVDLTAVLDGDGPPGPTILRRHDGLCLLYAGKVHALNAESESGKSWLALAACAERLHLGEAALYIDFEDDAPSLVARLQALGVDRQAIVDQFVYLRPDDAIDAVATAQLDRLLIEHRPSICIIDGVTEVMAQNGWSITDNDDAARFLLALPKRIARHGPAVVMIDHVTKDKESRGRYGIGAQHKLAGIDGAAYYLEVSEPFGVGRSGASRITCTKDRPGHIRGALPDGRSVGEMRVTSTSTGDVHISLTEHATSGGELQVRPTTLMEHISTACREMNDAGVQPTSNALLGTLKGQRRFLLAALSTLVTEGYIAAEAGARGARHHRSVRPYTAADDTPRATHPTAPSDPDEDL